MNPEPAQYLLRFDDLCPTMAAERFERFILIVQRHGIRPILAVVPDNQDPELRYQDPDPAFWDRMRSLQAAGATIAMHGFRHQCVSPGPSLLRLHSRTEFAGIAEETQREWIRNGIQILRKKGLRPRLFVAPRHGFDSATLSALAEEGLGFLSDGFATRAHIRKEVVCIPQQLWRPVKKPSGLWTICIHSNTAVSALEQELDLFLHESSKQFTNFDQLAKMVPKELSWSERMREALINYRARLRFARGQTTFTASR
jgi:predicted deacetylase